MRSRVKDHNSDDEGKENGKAEKKEVAIKKKTREEIE